MFKFGNKFGSLQKLRRTLSRRKRESVCILKQIREPCIPLTSPFISSFSLCWTVYKCKHVLDVCGSSVNSKKIKPACTPYNIWSACWFNFFFFWILLFFEFYYAVRGLGWKRFAKNTHFWRHALPPLNPSDFRTETYYLYIDLIYLIYRFWRFRTRISNKSISIEHIVQRFVVRKECFT